MKYLLSTTIGMIVMFLVALPTLTSVVLHHTASWVRPGLMMSSMLLAVVCVAAILACTFGIADSE